MHRWSWQYLHTGHTRSRVSAFAVLRIYIFVLIFRKLECSFPEIYYHLWGLLLKGICTSLSCRNIIFEVSKTKLRASQISNNSMFIIKKARTYVGVYTLSSSLKGIQNNVVKKKWNTWWNDTFPLWRFHIGRKYSGSFLLKRIECKQDMRNVT